MPEMAKSISAFTPSTSNLPDNKGKSMCKTRLLLIVLFGSLAPSVAHAADPGEKNLALGRPCQVFSSYEADGWSKTKLTGAGQGNLGWSSKAFTLHEKHTLYPEYVVVDLGRCATINQVVLHPRGDEANAGKGFPADFTIQVCEEGEPWRTVVEKKNYPAPNGADPQTIELHGAKGRYVKIEATRLREAEPGMYRFQLAEIEIFGSETTASPLGNVKGDSPIFADTKIGTVPLADKKSTLPCRLRCENCDNPIGMDAKLPRLSWWMQSSERGQRQTAYRVLLASSAEQLADDRGDLWDSGKVASDRSVGVVYGGKPLRSGSVYFWKVMLWDKDGRSTAWSRSATFITGKFEPDDWKGHWIGDADAPKHKPVYLRKEIDVEKPVKRATVFFCGLGQSELFIDGRRVGDYLLGPGFTTYDKRVQYLVFDVSDRFKKIGRKALGVVLMDGWYGLWRDPWVHRFETNRYVDRPKLLLDLQLEYEDGTQATISSDASWKCTADGPLTRAWLCEASIDHRLDMPGWDCTGFAEKGWRNASRVSGPAGKLVVQKEPPTRFIETVTPERLVFDEARKTWIYSFDREFMGFFQLRIAGTPGRQIKVITLPHDPNNPSVPARVNTVVLADGKPIVFRPHVIYTSICQIRVEGAEGPLKLDDLQGCRISGVGPVSGGFRCSNDLLNWLHEAVRRTQENYVTYLPNDSSREFKAWMEDPQNMLRSATYLFESQTMYERWQYDMLGDQRPDGNMANVSPGAFYDDYTSVWWSGTAVWLPWYAYLYYGDSRLLEESYPGMKKFVDFVGTTTKDSMIEWGLADWMPVEETPIPLINTPGYYLCADIVSRTAAMLGKPEEAKQYRLLAEQIKKRFNDKFLNRGTGVYGPGTQAAQTLPLALGMTPADVEPAAKQSLLRNIAAHHDHLSTGFVSTPYMLEILQDLAPDVGYRMTTAQDYPSWYSMTAGADCDLMMEEWAGKPINMPALGGNLAAWNMESLGGIRPDPGDCPNFRLSENGTVPLGDPPLGVALGNAAGGGFKHIIIKPNVVGDLHWVECWYDSAYGRITSRWRRRAGQLNVEVVVPPNATATVFLPTPQPEAVTESGKSLRNSPGITVAGVEDGRTVLHVGSGRYQFSISRER
jgi:alpha-L-rhamnosidase